MENYKQKYEEALEQAKQELRACGSLDCDAARQIFRFFPELKESEDELIREELIHFLEVCQDTHLVGNMKREKWISWLEKQGEKEETSCDRCRKEQPSHSCQDITSLGRCYMEGEQKPTDEFKPKFKVGDWIVNDFSKNIFLIKSYNSGYCTLEDTKGKFYNPCLPPNIAFHLWTISDAKNGDVLVCDDKRPFIFKGLLDPKHPIHPVAYCGIDDGDCFTVSSGVNWWTDDYVEPATKEQRTLLFTKMKEAGYEWYDEKKELTKNKL